MEEISAHLVTDAVNTPFMEESDDAVFSTPFLKRIIKHLEKKFVFYSHDITENKLLHLSGAVESIFGLSTSQALNVHWITHINWSDDSIMKCFEFFRKLQNQEVTHNYMEIDFTHPDGTQKYVSVHSYIGMNQNGFPVIEGIVEEITQRKLLEQEMNYLATHDSLTSLCNRKTIENRLETDLLEAKRYKHSLSCIVLDVDHFKKINDTYGHCGGDFVLQNFSTILNDSIRETDYLARFGGEEFLIVLPFTDKNEAKTLAQRLLDNIAKNPIALSEKTELFVTASLGVASYPIHASSMQQLISAADTAMYKAKNSGRNQVVCYDESSL